MPETFQPTNAPFIVELADEIDMANSGAVGDRLCRAVHRAGDVMAVDLSNVTFMDSCAVRMMARVHNYAESVGKSVTWQGAGPNHLRVFEITGVDNLLHLAA